jgi:hypothetical protein
VARGSVRLPWEFEVSGIYRATSGVYFTATGEFTDYDGDGIVSARPVGTKRNQFRGPQTSNLDLTVERPFHFADRYTASILLEGFNVFNARNPRLINSFYVDGAPGPEFGQTLVPLPGREVQIGMRFQF